MLGMTKPASPATPEEHKVSNFLRQIIEADLDKGTYASRRWAGSPGDAAHHAKGEPDPAKMRCPVDEMGKNSVNPSTTPITAALSNKTISIQLL
jgi:hypothetical protein